MRRQRRDIWRCPRCSGVHLATGELAGRLRLLDIAADVIRDVLTLRKAYESALRCPSCQRPMQGGTMATVDLHRCEAEDQIWLDHKRLDRIVELADAQHESRRGWLARLRAHLFAS
jgi:Zn-finger nucleic acid-binding protein